MVNNSLHYVRRDTECLVHQPVTIVRRRSWSVQGGNGSCPSRSRSPPIHTSRRLFMRLKPDSGLLPVVVKTKFGYSRGSGLRIATT